jgi:hypothetical protein
MDLSAIPGCSEEVYLQDYSEEIRKAEEGVPREEQLAVTVNYVNEGDRIKHAAMKARRETHVMPDRVIEITVDNDRERVEMEVYLTLNYVRNLKSNGKEVFQAVPVSLMGRERFSEIWRSLPPMITDAVYSAVLLRNPEWVWEG